jgi:transcriptional regulator with XRE-family HTH domain
MMTEFEFQIFCRDVVMNDDSFLDRLHEAGCDDALVFFKDGYVCLDFSREAENAEDAVLSAIKDIGTSGIGGEIERVEPDDLAGLSEIARRVGVTRASLQKYARGISKIGKDFPKPVANIAGAKRELYSAVEVMDWMCVKNRIVIPDQVVELSRVIAKTNQAMLIVKAQKDSDLQRLLARLTA